MLRKPDGDLTQDSSTMSEMLNTFFASVMTHEPADEPIPHLEYDRNPPPFPRKIVFDTEEVAKFQQQIKPNKACGPDLIHPRVLRMCPALVKPMTIMFNASMSSGILPQDWRDAHVTPIYKGSCRLSCKNYRPVSLTSQMVKLMEKLVLSRLWDYLNSFQSLSVDQHGFQPGASCTTQLLDCLDDWTRMADEGKSVDIIYLDFAKAFDSVPHKRLAHKLHTIGIQGTMLRWLQAFLAHRRQRVVLQGMQSDWLPCTSGVPQGSLLGPTLFLIYIDDMPLNLESDVKLFADDSKVYRAVRSHVDEDTLNRDLAKLATWSARWLLRFNESKCVVLTVQPQHRDNVPRYTLNGVYLQPVTEQKDLGVIITSDLKPTTHINKICAKSRSKIGLIKRCFTQLSPEKMRILFQSLVRPLLEFASPAWSPWLVKDIENLESVQNKCMRMSNSTGWEPLVSRRRKADLREAYKCLNGESKLKPTKLFSLSNQALRGQQRLSQQYSRTDLRKHYFSRRVVRDWNYVSNLPPISTTYAQFKSKLRRVTLP